MATRSNIAVQQEDGTFLFIYCHWDGYYEGNGKLLLDHYSDVTKARQLAALGDISSLGEEIGEKQDFDKPNRNWVVSYGRDRGETGVEPRVCADVDDVLGHFREQYLYVMQKTDDGSYQWFASHRSGLKLLTTILLDGEEEDDEDD